MNKFKNIILVLATIFAALLLFTGTVHAEADPLLDNKTALELAQERVDNKIADINAISEQHLTVEEERDLLAKDVAELKSLVTELKARIEEKKAKEEADRLEAIRQAELAEARKKASVPRPVSSGANTYTYGYCTWYAKSQRPDMPNGLGNANTWYARYTGSKGSIPKIGAVAATTRGALGHVAIVHAVNGDGTIVIREMNGVAGWGAVGYRTESASSYLYLY